MSEGYNGWSNYETWCVSLWLSNDEGTYSDTREMAAAVLERSEESQTPVSDLADWLGAYVSDLPECAAVFDGPASFVCDLLNASLGDVDWQEIAENLLSELS